MLAKISFIHSTKGHKLSDQQSTDSSDLKIEAFFPITSNRVTIGNTFDDSIRIYDFVSSKENFKYEISVINNENFVNSNEFFIRTVRGKPFDFNGLPAPPNRRIEVKNNDRITIGHKTLIFNKCISTPKSVSESKPQDSVSEVEPLKHKMCENITDISHNTTDCEPTVEVTNKTGAETEPKEMSKSGVESRNESTIVVIDSSQTEDESEEKPNKKAKVGRPRNSSETILKTKKPQNKTKVELKIETGSPSIDRQLSDAPKTRAPTRQRNTRTDNKSEKTSLNSRKTRNQMKSESNEEKSSEIEKSKRKTNITAGKESFVSIKKSKKVEFHPNIKALGIKGHEIQETDEVIPIKKVKRGEKLPQTEQESNQPSSRSKKLTNERTKTKVQKERQKIEEKTGNKSKTRAKRGISPTSDESEPLKKTRNRGKDSKIKSIEPKSVKNEVKPNKRPKRGVKQIEDNKRTLRSRNTTK